MNVLLTFIDYIPCNGNGVADFLSDIIMWGFLTLGICGEYSLHGRCGIMSFLHIIRRW